MPRKYTKITPQVIEKTRKYLADDRNFSKSEVARLVGISEHSIQRIVQGYYDPPVEQQNTETQQVDSNQNSKAYITEIPFEKMETLLKYEAFIDEMFAISVKSDKADDELYLPRHYINQMFARYFPERLKKRLEELDTYA